MELEYIPERSPAELVQYANDKAANRKMAQIAKYVFHPDDLVVTLGYREGESPSWAKGERMVIDFLSSVGTLMEIYGHKFRYIFATKIEGDELFHAVMANLSSDDVPLLEAMWRGPLCNVQKVESKTFSGWSWSMRGTGEGRPKGRKKWHYSKTIVRN